MNSGLRRDYFVPVFIALVGLAWTSLFALERSPYARYVQHGELGHLHTEHGVGVIAGQAALYIVGWLLMIVAMMLPTVLPLIQIFRRLIRDRLDRGALVGLLLAGYLTAWLAFGFVAHTGDWWLHQWFAHHTWLQDDAWLFGAAPLIVAGAFQFSSLKYRCLDKCSTPLGFVMARWHDGHPPGRQAFRMGLDHGVFCVGCCWALMLLMFAVGTGNVGWMLALGAFMAMEKNLPWGRRISKPLGIALLSWAVVIAIDHTWTWQ